jgi:tetratricopeptide (TPR) repeat protein
VAREIDADRFQSATDIYLEARRSDPFFHLDADAQVKTAHWLERSGLYAHAVNAHLDFARFNIDDPRSVHSLARAATLLATRLQRSTESIDVIEQALTRFPDHPLREWLESELQSLRRGPRVLSARAG